MAFWTLFEVASMPVLQVLLISVLGAVLATDYFNILNADARKYMNKVVFIIFTPSLMFASLAKTVTLQEIISWWFMPVNIGLTFLFGGILGWIVAKVLKPERHLEGLVIAICSSGNLGNLVLIVIPAICNEEGSPFGESSICSVRGAAYASFSMALGGFYIWTYTYHLIRTASAIYHKKPFPIEGPKKVPNTEMDAGVDAQLLKTEAGEVGHEQVVMALPTSTMTDHHMGSQEVVQFNESLDDKKVNFWSKLKGIIHQIVDELLAPPTIGSILGFIFGAVPWLKSLLIGTNAPLRVIQDSIRLLGDGTIPCITLILGGNLIQGLRKGRLKPLVIISVLVVRYVLLPLIGVGVTRLAGHLGFLPQDPLYHYVLMIQFTLPPAMNIGTMTQLFDVGQDDCSVLFLWTYLVAAFALTIWSTFYMYILS